MTNRGNMIRDLSFTEAARLKLNRKSYLRSIFSVMRPYQWVKNLFVFVPLLFGKKLTEGIAIEHSLIAFAVFCLIASSLYIFNDWIDAEEDRKHPEKRFRPISSGALPSSVALFCALILAVSAFSLTYFVGIRFFLVAALYFVLTLAYCLLLKKMIVLDCMTIAAGFVLRVVGGAFAVEVMPTNWLIVCAFLLALFLAFTKRRQELVVLSKQAGEHREVLNEYSIGYLEQLNSIIIGASIVCYALYTVAPETVARFETSNLIYGTVFVIYGMFRYLALIKNPENGGNPTKMLLKDKPLALAVIGWAIYNAAIIYQNSLADFLYRFI